MYIFFCSVNCTSGCLKCPSVFCVREAYITSKTEQIFLTTKHFITIRLEWISCYSQAKMRGKVSLKVSVRNAKHKRASV